MQASRYHIFSLPLELLDTLAPRNFVDRVPSRSNTPEPPTTFNTGPRACNICQGVTFLDVDQQRAHFRTDWHRYNVKVRLDGGKPVSEPGFVQLVDALDDSISGSASPTDEDDDDDSDAVNTLLNKTKRLNTRSPSPDATSRNAPLTALTWFHSPPSTQLGIYRSLLPLRMEPKNYLDELRRMQSPVEGGLTWALFMVAGGHFAGAVVRVSHPDDENTQDLDPQPRKQKPKKPKPETEVLLHKTFHRYTTRRKQGGSQSVNDNAQGFAKSAGAQLRRYGEQALRDDIRGLLQEWADELAGCERIWIRASVSNRRIFFDFDEAPFVKGDERLRTFPFPTRRPTQSELTRSLAELTRPKISHFTEEDLRTQDEAYIASLPRPKPAPTIVHPESEKPKQPKISKEEELLREKWDRLLEMVVKGRLDPLKAFLDRESSTIGGVDALIPQWTGERRATILQIAVQNDHEDVTRWLLEEARADPTIPVPSSNPGEVVDEDEGHKSDASVPVQKASRRTAYDLARTKVIRDIFRRCAASHPDWWDWFGIARVPSALSQEMEEERDEKKKVRRKGLKDRIKEREAREKEKEKEKEKEHSITPPMEVKMVVNEVANATPRRLGGVTGDGLAGLTPDMKARAEREQRARAAEARLKRLAN